MMNTTNNITADDIRSFRASMSYCKITTAQCDAALAGDEAALVQVTKSIIASRPKSFSLGGRGR